MRRTRKTFGLVVFFAVLGLFLPPLPGRGVPPNVPRLENLRALAKLYGLLRYFHPSDEAARIDWDALAVLAAGKVKDAPDAPALKAALEGVFLPVAPSLRLSLPGEKPGDASRISVPSPSDPGSVSWQHFGLGSGAPDSIYRSIRLNRPTEVGGQATLAQALDISEHRGKTVRLSAWVKVQAGDLSSRVQLWLRVDTPAGAAFFDNMFDRPIRSPAWTEASISGPVAADAQRIAFGALVYGKGRFLVDGFSLSVKDATGRETRIDVPNGGFEEGEARLPPKAWNVQSPSLENRLRNDEAKEGKRSLAFQSRTQPFSGPLFKGQAPAGGLLDKDIGRGLRARFPLVLGSDKRGTLPRPDPKNLAGLRASLETLIRSPLGGGNEDVRLADVIIAWNVFQHFFPYFDAIRADWDEVLTRGLERALADRTEEAFLRTLGWLVARLEDGHANVYHPLLNKLGWPPFMVEWIEEKPVITASREASFRPGDIVLALDGRKAEDVLRAEEEYLSGSPQWRRVRSTAQFGLGPLAAASRVKLLRSGKTLDFPFQRTPQPPAPAPEVRPPIDRAAERVFYVDLRRAAWPDIAARLNELSKARGLVFDLRGYPNGNHQLLSHLLRQPDKSSAWMKIPLVLRPDRRDWTYRETGWNLPASSPRIAGRVVFLTDARAISYSESFLSFVEHYKLGDIVGEPTAGANGNVNSFSLPGGYSVSWTGMRVVKHDGSRHHTVGVLPTVPCRRTIAGVSAGRDELLDKALEIVGQ